MNWKAVNKEVQKFRFKIWKLARNKDFKNLRNFQKLFVNYSYNTLYSIRKVTSINSGSETPGFDNVIINTPEQRLQLFHEIGEMRWQEYEPIATKRIYLAKPDGKQRPIGIPTIRERVIQQIMKNALEPEWEALFEPSSYGFRPSRSVNDAIEKRKVGPETHYSEKAELKPAPASRKTKK